MPQKIVEWLKNHHFYFILLPVFFVLHGYNENAGFVPAKDLLSLAAVYVAAAAVIFLLWFLLLKNAAKSALLTAYIFSFFLFYGALQDFLKLHLFFASRYRFLLPAFLLGLLALVIFLKKRQRDLGALPLFLNLLTCIYVLLELAGITGNAIHPRANRFSVYSFAKEGRYPVVQSTDKPDIYFLVFDEYASTLSLKEHYGFVNPLDSFLRTRAFSIQEKARSNYHYTWVSIASTLNMSYVNGLYNNKLMVPEDLSYSLELLKNNSVIGFLSQQGYTVANFSDFDLAGNPSAVRQELLPVKTRLITANTFFERIDRDLGWMLGSMSIDSNGKLLHVAANNQALLAMTADFSKQKRAKPAFVFMHVYMPHIPFVYDRQGKERGLAAVTEDNKREYQNVPAYLDYLQYGNSSIEKLVDNIRHNTNDQAVIILMGDHGFREKMYQNEPQNFQPMNAVYLPGRNYKLLYDSISSVNQFRVIFNTVFQQSLPLLPDSVVFLRLSKTSYVK